MGELLVVVDQIEKTTKHLFFFKNTKEVLNSIEYFEISPL